LAAAGNENRGIFKAVKKLFFAFVIASLWAAISCGAVYAAPKSDGSSTYGYDWIQNSGLPKEDAAVVKALYQRFADYARAVNNYNKDLAPDFQGNYYLKGIDVSDLYLPTNMVGSGDEQSIGEGDLTDHTKRMLGIAYAVFTNDNPQYYMFEGFIYGGYGKAIGGKSKIDAVTLAVSPEYAKALVRQANKSVIEAKFGEYKQLASSVTSDYDKVRLVHDKILAERDYSNANGKGDINAYAHNILGVMDTSTVGPVCESYSKAFAYILNRLGVETLSIPGGTPEGLDAGSGHMWNVVKVSGKWYYCDLTFDELDTLDASSGDYDYNNQMNCISYKYFLVGDTNKTLGDNDDSTFAQIHKSAGAQGVELDGDMVYGYESPAVSPSDYDLIKGTRYTYLTNNGLLDEVYGLPAIHRYVIAKSKILTSETPDSRDGNPVLYNVRTNSYAYNYGPYVFGPFNAGDTPDITLYKWDYYPGHEYLDDSFRDGNYKRLIQGGDYTVQLEQPVKSGLNRCWIYGIGDYRGIDFVMVNVLGSGAPNKPEETPPPAGNPTAPTQKRVADITLNDVALSINGVTVTDSDTLLYNDTLYFPISLAAGYLGYNADYDGGRQITNLTYNGVPAAPPDGPPRARKAVSGANLEINVIRLYIDGSQAEGINTLTYKDRLYVPINAVANRLGLKADYDSESNTTYISTEK